MKSNSKPVKPHQGKNIRFFREAKHIKQETFAEMLGVSQSLITNIERRSKVEDELLVKCATVLGVTVDTLKNLELDKVLHSISGNNFTIDNSGSLIIGSDNETENHFNPIEKLVEVYDTMITELKEQNKKLQEALEKCQ